MSTILKLSIVKLNLWFLKFRTVCCKTIGLELPREGGDGRTARTDRRTHRGIIVSELSPLGTGMRTRGTCAQAHEKEILECGTQLPVQLPVRPQSGFQAVIKSAASAADPPLKKLSKI